MYMAVKKSMVGESKGQVKRKLIQQNLDPDEYEIIEVEIIEVKDDRLEDPEYCPTPEELREQMRDPRYWRDHDKEVVERIENGFKRLYGGK